METWIPKVKTLRDLFLSGILAIGGGIGMAWFLHQEPNRQQEAEKAIENVIAGPVILEVKIDPAVNGVYWVLSHMNTEDLFKLKAVDNICSMQTFSCRGLTKGSVLTLIDGILKQREEDLQNTQARTAQRSAQIAEKSADIANRSSIATLFSVGASFFSLGISTLSYFKK